MPVADQGRLKRRKGPALLARHNAVRDQLTAGCMQVGPAAALTFSGMLLARLASADAGDAAGENVVQSLALWPSVSGEPGATVSSSSPAAAAALRHQ